MSSKPYPKEKEKIPSPGNYNLRQASHLAVPSYRFGLEKKRDMSLSHSKFVSGPKEIMILMPILSSKIPKFSFGKKLRGADKTPKIPGND